MSTPFKVICIDDGESDEDCQIIDDGFDLKVGDTYTVIRIVTGFGYFTEKPEDCYILEEQPTPFVAFPAKWFAPLSEIDETELVNEVNKETV